MDNVTHALVGATLADLALRPAASPSTRRVFVAAAVVAANLPDIDLIYTGITTQPLGYLLHHRGHSHTWPGLLVLGMCLLAAFRLWPAARRVVAEERARFAWLVAGGLASHLLLDALNVYGTHLFYPFTARWYFGDAVFIFEPWLWLLLGLSVAGNSSTRAGRLTVGALTALLPVALAWFGLLNMTPLLVLAIVGVVLSLLFSGLSARTRAVVASALSLVMVVGMLQVSARVKADVRIEAASSGAVPIVDIVANPNPAVPWCWMVMTIQQDADAGTFTVRRGTLSLWPAATPATSCASHRLMSQGQDQATEESAGQRLVWTESWRGDLEMLRNLHTNQCWARAWFQFGRVPFVVDDVLLDLRFENPMSANFSAISLQRGAEGTCPGNLTSWESPRRDLLGP